MVETLACDTYSQQCDWIVGQAAVVYFPNDNHVHSVFLEKSAEHVAYGHLAAAAAAAASSVTVNVDRHYKNQSNERLQLVWVIY